MNEELNPYNYASLSDPEKLIYQKLKEENIPPTMIEFTDPLELCATPR